jgi:para-aminobenzoate synthetase/4-amino-4-deoxychorismate lyase
VNSSPYLIFDFPSASGENAESLVFQKPIRVFETYDLSEVRETLQDVSNAAKRGYFVAGFVSYDSSSAFGDGMAANVAPDFPLVWFGEFEKPVPASCLGGDFNLVKDVSEWTSEIDYEQYSGAIDEILRRIAAGDTYQVNFTHRLRGKVYVDPIGFYRTLRAAHPAPYSAYLNTGRHAIVSISPELFFEKNDSLLRSMPMKGTASRGIFYDDDLEARDALKQSEKERAENVMIVDLMRNDFGKIARTGAVRAPSLFDCLALPTVWQMTSRVECEIDPALSFSDILAATFPPGSVTGAPKPITTRIIRELEYSPRKLYCGCIGYITPENDSVFNVAIRTVIVDLETRDAECGVGGGITSMSNPYSEHKESLSKSLFLNSSKEPEGLLETMRAENGTIFLLDRHLNRLENSARRFGFKCDREAIKSALNEKIYDQDLQRMRLILNRSGQFEIEIYLLARSPEILLFAIENENRIDKHDIRVYHKLSDRSFYQSIYNRHFARDSADWDVLMLNSDNEITEFTKGNIVLDLNGELITPPVACGLLPGVFRAELLEEGRIIERVISFDDLLKADRVWFINSLRKWIEAKVFSATTTNKN